MKGGQFYSYPSGWVQLAFEPMQESVFPPRYNLHGTLYHNLDMMPPLKKIYYLLWMTIHSSQSTFFNGHKIKECIKNIHSWLEIIQKLWWIYSILYCSTLCVPYLYVVNILCIRTQPSRILILKIVIEEVGEMEHHLINLKVVEVHARWRSIRHK